MSDTKELMLSTLPAGYEVVEDREYEGGDSEGLIYEPGCGWREGSNIPMRWSECECECEWQEGYRYARKVTVPVVKWESEPPTEPGWYWAKNETETPFICYFDNLQREILWNGANRKLWKWWPIPIQPPKEGE